MEKLHLSLISMLLIFLWGTKVYAEYSLEYPKQPLNANQIAEQVYLVSHGKLLNASASRKHKKEISMVVTRPPLDKRKPGRTATVNTFETYGKNSPEDPAGRSE